MLNIIMRLLLFINLTLLIYYAIKMIKVRSYRKGNKSISSIIRNSETKISKSIEEFKQMSFINKLFVYPIVLLVLLIIMFLPLSIFIGVPVVFGIKYSWRFGFLVLFGLLSVFSFIWIRLILFKKDKVIDSQERC